MSHARGSANGFSKLNEEWIVTDRVSYAFGHATVLELAQKRGVDPLTVRSYLRGHTWRHVPFVLPKGLMCGDGKLGPEVQRLAREGLSAHVIGRRLGIAPVRVRRLLQQPVTVVPPMVQQLVDGMAARQSERQ